MKRLVTLAALSVSMFLSPHSYAQGDILLAGKPPGYVRYGLFTSDAMQGFEFTSHVNATVTSLGIFDYNINGLEYDGDGLLFAHEIGLWTSSGELLASATIPAGAAAPLADGYRWAALQVPVLIVSGGDYVLGASYRHEPTSGGDLFYDTALINQSFTVKWARYYLTGALEFPEWIREYEFGYFGPNLIATEEPLPEPSTMTMLGMLVVSAFVYALFRRRKLLIQ